MPPSRRSANSPVKSRRSRGSIPTGFENERESPPPPFAPEAALAPPFAGFADAPPEPDSTRSGSSPRRETAASAPRRSAASTVPETVFPSRLLAW